MQETRDLSATAVKAVSANMTMFIQLLGLGVALWAPPIAIMIWMSGNFTDMRADLADMETRLTARIQELDDRIDSVDNKLVAIGDMTVIAFTDGEISSDELEAIWARANSA